MQDVEANEAAVVESATFGKELPLSRDEQESPDLNPLYPEYSIENQSLYVDYSCEAATTTEESAVSEQRSERSPSDESETTPPSDELVARHNDTDAVVEAEDAAQIAAVSIGSLSTECAVDDSKSQNTDEESTSGVSSAVTTRAPDKEIADSDNSSEAYLTPTEANDAEKKCDPEGGTAIAAEEPLRDDDDDAVDCDEARCNGGTAEEPCERDVDRSPVSVPGDLVEESAYAPVAVVCDETKSEQVPKDAEGDLQSSSQISDSSLSEPCSPIRSEEIAECAEGRELAEIADSAERASDQQEAEAAATEPEIETEASVLGEQQESGTRSGEFVFSFTIIGSILLESKLKSNS